jgi:hypothetical protein
MKGLGQRDEGDDKMRKTKDAWLFVHWRYVYGVPASGEAGKGKLVSLGVICTRPR